MNPDARTSENDVPFIVIFNKRALAARALRRSGMEEAMRERRLPHEIIDSTTSEQACCAAEDAANEGYIAVAAGGDGTIRDVVSGVLDSGNPDAVVGHVPLGTGNDLARCLGRVGHGIDRALDALQDRRAIPIDVGQANGEYFLNVLGIGFDAEVARRQQDRKYKFPSYFPDVIRAFHDYQPEDYHARWEGGERSGPALMIAAMNGKFEGGGVKVAPHASLEDGLLDYYWIDPITRLQFARYIRAVRWGTHGKLPMVRYWTLNRVTVASDSRMRYHLDGEYREMTAGGELEIVLHAGRVNVIV